VLLESSHSADGPAATASEPAVVGAIALAEAGAALAVCDREGRVIGGSPSGRALLVRMGAVLDSLPAALPAGLWQLVSSRPIGMASQWRSTNSVHAVLGCTRYRLGADSWLLIMSEISQKQRAMAQQLHQQRLEALGRLVATTAHDLRSPLSSIVFNSDVLAARLDEMPPERIRETAGDMRTAATRLRATIDCLLDYVRLGPQLPTQVSIKEILARMQSLLRPHLRAGGHRLLDVTSSEADTVLGNSLAVEQVFVNLVLNAIEAARGPITVRVSSRLEGWLLRVLVEDDGPGILPEHCLQVFDPFFTTKRDGTGIGLSAAREAARAAGGDVQLVRWNEGAAFAVLLPASTPEGGS
jgi:signal transduction histidine kinase